MGDRGRDSEGLKRDEAETRQMKKGAETEYYERIKKKKSENELKQDEEGGEQRRRTDDWQEKSQRGMRVKALMKMTGGYSMTWAVMYLRKRVYGDQ